MKPNKKSFIAVLPVMMLAGCPQRTSNPPGEAPLSPTTTKTTEPVTPEAKVEPPVVPTPDPKYPPISYSERQNGPLGCYVWIGGNPPQQEKVSCTAPIEPIPKGGTWCEVASAEDPNKKVPVNCNSK